MPRRYDYDADDIGNVEYRGKQLTDRALGKLEDRAAFFGPPESMSWFYGQYQACIYDTKFMDLAHAWIDGNATAPWYWHEQSGNHGHSVETHVWFSSLDDLSRFAAEWDGKGPDGSVGQAFTLSPQALRMNGKTIGARLRVAEVVTGNTGDEDAEASVWSKGP